MTRSGGPGEDGVDGSDHDRSPRDEILAQVHSARVEFERQFEAGKAQFEETQEKIKARTGRNLLGAILIGLGVGAALLLSLLVVKELFMLFAVVMVGFGTVELVQAFRKRDLLVPIVPSVAVAVLTVPAAYYYGAAGQFISVIAGILLISIWRIVAAFARGTRANLLRDLGAGAFVQGYVTFLATFAVVLTAAEGGQWWTLAFIITVVCVDTGAYAFGLSFGKHPMAPVISPKKTWEGFAGAAVTSTVAGVLLAIFMLDEPWWFGIGFGLALLLTATLGDLAESLIKRDLGIKDMSSWLPGHGGFLDRLDSILPSAAVAYAAFAFFG
ncbi:phosphatidate cytidylyltransferase [Agromyces protaetiae]|uniref:phosphatidate cytidylyltransferase n=1 Tax=Agromyces protaetiae TaxID=2509455 RepID=UPI001FB5F83F|nr:phosphatidate cytidylyltransferase [Agromyces protaetiae]